MSTYSISSLKAKTKRPFSKRWWIWCSTSFKKEIKQINRKRAHQNRSLAVYQKKVLFIRIWTAITQAKWSVTKEEFQRWMTQNRCQTWWTNKITPTRKMEKSVISKLVSFKDSRCNSIYCKGWTKINSRHPKGKLRIYLKTIWSQKQWITFWTRRRQALKFLIISWSSLDNASTRSTKQLRMHRRVRQVWMSTIGKNKALMMSTRSRFLKFHRISLRTLTHQVKDPTIWVLQHNRKTQTGDSRIIPKQAKRWRLNSSKFNSNQVSKHSNYT